MKKSYLSPLYIVTLFAVLFFGCKNEELSPYEEPLPGVHAYGQIADSGPSNFIYGQVNTAVTFNIQWISIDGALEVEKVDLYLLFNENYEDALGNPLVARHGGGDGVLYATLVGEALPGNREPFTLQVDQAEMYSLYEGISYDYNGDGTATPVFNNPDRPDRVVGSAPFISEDDFVIRWELTTTEGLVYSSWSPSVCTELPGANCNVQWSVIASE